MRKIIIKQISIVTVTFNQTNVFQCIHAPKLPALAITAGFQNKIVELLNEKLRKALRQNYDPFIMKMMEHKTDD